jgi:cation diffusion facilitator family transporter
MIALSSVVAAYEALNRLLHPRPVTGVGVLFVAGIVGFIGNELVALFRIREGNAIGSAALVADGYHARTDGFTSLAVAMGAIGVWAGFEHADPIIGLGISIAIFAVLRGAAKQVYYRLMDAVESALVDKVESVAVTTPGVLGVSAAQVRWLGHRLAADVAIRVDGTLPVREGHGIAEHVRHHLLEAVAHLDDVNVHVDPDVGHDDDVEGHLVVSAEHLRHDEHR